MGYRVLKHWIAFFDLTKPVLTAISHVRNLRSNDFVNPGFDCHEGIHRRQPAQDFDSVSGCCLLQLSGGAFVSL